MQRLMIKIIQSTKDTGMGKGRKRTVLKMKRKAGQAKKKARLLKRIAAGKKK